MTDEFMQRDPALGDALRSASPDPMNHPINWTAMRRAIDDRASTELSRRRVQRRRMRFALPASLAAGIALFFLAEQLPPRTPATPTAGSTVPSQVSIDELFDANVSEGQFRALLSGAADANDLLSIAAADERP
jgi:hypothetical protein